MKIIYSIILLNLFFSNCFSQNYIKYYNTSNKADSLQYFKNYEKALNIYEVAFTLVDFVHSDKLIKAGFTAINLNKYDIAEEYFKQAIINGNNKDFLNYKEFKKNKKQFKNLITNLPEFETEFATNINHKFKNKIDSLYTIDQSIRNNKTLTQEKDDEIFNTLLMLIKKHGFPSEKKVGYKSYKNANIILHHNLRLVKNEKYLLEFSKNHIENGEYRPEDFAWTIDQNYVWFKSLNPIYYFQVLQTKNLTPDIKQNINKKRREIGLKPIEAYKEGKNTFQLLW